MKHIGSKYTESSRNQNILQTPFTGGLLLLLCQWNCWVYLCGLYGLRLLLLLQRWNCRVYLFWTWMVFDYFYCYDDGIVEFTFCGLSGLQILLLLQQWNCWVYLLWTRMVCDYCQAWLSAGESCVSHCLSERLSPASLKNTHTLLIQQGGSVILHLQSYFY